MCDVCAISRTYDSSFFFYFIISIWQFASRPYDDNYIIVIVMIICISGRSGRRMIATRLGGRAHTGARVRYPVAVHTISFRTTAHGTNGLYFRIIRMAYCVRVLCSCFFFFLSFLFCGFRLLYPRPETTVKLTSEFRGAIVVCALRGRDVRRAPLCVIKQSGRRRHPKHITGHRGLIRFRKN